MRFGFFAGPHFFLRVAEGRFSGGFGENWCFGVVFLW
jgi:hypothetical protein